MENPSSGGGSNSAVVAVLVVVVVALAAWFAYSQGYIGGKATTSDQPEVQINLPAGSTPKPSSGY